MVAHWSALLAQYKPGELNQGGCKQGQLRWAPPEPCGCDGCGLRLRHYFADHSPVVARPLDAAGQGRVTHC
ncbi:hypothetical protein WJX73_006173 [Symbiochloris irregularis]|uniref:Uncharacterized protein n=1 Tax=Symbiochloris irregularis TaxID=706552 RepID=A0AAW1PFM5_9CHLO